MRPKDRFSGLRERMKVQLHVQFVNLQVIQTALLFDVAAIVKVKPCTVAIARFSNKIAETMLQNIHRFERFATF